MAVGVAVAVVAFAVLQVFSANFHILGSYKDTRDHEIESQAMMVALWAIATPFLLLGVRRRGSVAAISVASWVALFLMGRPWFWPATRGSVASAGSLDPVWWLFGVPWVLVALTIVIGARSARSAGLATRVVAGTTIVFIAAVSIGTAAWCV